MFDREGGFITNKPPFIYLSAYLPMYETKILYMVILMYDKIKRSLF